jgi:hypothetical protein
MAGAARPDSSGSCDVAPALTFGTSHAGTGARHRIATIAISAAAPAWMQVWHLDAIQGTKPAYPVHTDRTTTPRPLERSP